MKTIGEQVKEFRLDQGWNTTAMAKAVGTSRQNIESLEATGNRQPRYLKKLASVMGLTTDALINGSYVSRTLAAQLPNPARNSQISDEKQLLVLVAPAPAAINFDEAIRVLADAISASPSRGSDVLIGALTSLAKDPDKLMHRQVLATIINAPDQSSEKAA